MAELLSTTHRVESQLLSHADFPLDDLGRELGLTEAFFETVLIQPAFDPTGLDPTGLASGSIQRRTATSPRTPCCGWGSARMASSR